jgi:chitinase
MRNILVILLSLCVLFAYTASASSHHTTHKHKSLSHHSTKRAHHVTAHHSSKNKKSTKKISKKTNKKVTKKTKKHTTKKASVKKVNDKSYPNHKVIAYVLDWDIPKNVQWSKLDHIAYAFAEPDAKGNLKGFESGNLKSGKKKNSFTYANVCYAIRKI